MDEILRLDFHDGIPKSGASSGTVLFSDEHAHVVIAFLRRHHERPAALHLLIHCEAGISRSAAIAVFAAGECQIPLTGQFAFLNPWGLSTLVKTAYPHYAFDRLSGRRN